MRSFKISSFLGVLLLITQCYAYKPVVLLHGIMSDATSMQIIGEQIKSVRTNKMGYLRTIRK